MIFYKVMKILATVLLIYQGMYYAINQPGSMSSFVAVLIHGIAFFAIWFSEERKKS